MPVTPTYPGVYLEEVSSGVRTITGVATSIAAFVGYTSRGILNKAVRIFNFGDFERQFGGLHPDSLVSYAVQQFFLNGGTEAYVVRVAQGAQPAQVNLLDRTGAVSLQVQAASAGVWGNYVRLSVDYATANPDSTFNLTVSRYELQNNVEVLVERERFQNLSMSALSPNFVRDVIANSSALIRVTVPAPPNPGPTGISLSKNLATFPAITANTSVLTGILNGTKPFTLTLTSVPTTLTQLRNAINAAIGTAGLNAELSVSRTDAVGAANAGDYIRLISADTTERSSVQVVRATTNDLSAIMGMGLGSGGREIDGTASRRPVPSGAYSSDLAALMHANPVTTVGGNVDVTVVDNMPPPAASPSLVNPTPVTFAIPANTDVGIPLRDALQTLLRASGQAVLREATVTLDGYTMRVMLSPNAPPNASINLVGAGVAGLNFTQNLKEYRLGTGVTFAGQTGAVTGIDGNLPGAVDLVGNFGSKTGIYALRDVDLFNMLVIPETAVLPEVAGNSVIQNAIAFCEEERAFYLIDPPNVRDFNTIGDWATVSTSRNAAVYFPQVQVADPFANFRPRNLPPSGTIAGVFARTDATRGVWKAPAGTDASLSGVQALQHVLTDAENGVLNPLGVNCLRTFPVYGTVSWGARTRKGADAQADEYKYVPVRRLALFLEESLYRGTQWVVFEPNDARLWAQIRLNLGSFMQNLFRQGAFQGSSPRDAYFVKCDGETTIQNDINLGIVNIVVGFAPLKPAEFVIIKIQQIAGQIAT